MPTLHSHTHCQVAPVDTQAKTWQRVCLSNRTTDRQTDEEEKALGGNSRLPQVAVTWLIKGLCSYSASVQVDSLVLLNRHLRQAAKRYRQV